MNYILVGNLVIFIVGLLINSFANSTLINIVIINERTISATFTVNPSTTVISCYNPMNLLGEYTVIDYYTGMYVVR